MKRKTNWWDFLTFMMFAGRLHGNPRNPVDKYAIRWRTNRPWQPGRF